MQGVGIEVAEPCLAWPLIVNGLRNPALRIVAFNDDEMEGNVVAEPLLVFKVEKNGPKIDENSTF